MRTVLGALAGLVLGGLAAFLAGIGLPEVLPISQAEGAYMMGVMFFWVPVAAAAGALAGALLARRRG